MSAYRLCFPLYANGRTTGLVVDSGDGVTHAVPVFEGFSIPHAVFKNYISGRAITDRMEKLLADDTITSGGGDSAWWQIVKSMKEKTCYVALDCQAEQEKASSSQ